MSTAFAHWHQFVSLSRAETATRTLARTKIKEIEDEILAHDGQAERATKKVEETKVAIAEVKAQVDSDTRKLIHIKQ